VTIVRIITAVILVGVGFFGMYWIAQRGPLVFGLNETPETQGFPVIAYGYAMTAIGVILGSIYRELQALRAAGIKRITNVRRFFRDVFRSIDFWMSACGSPIVYALLWKSLEGGSVAALTIIALQNGFCCTVIIEKLMNQGGTAPQPAAPASP
jgi:hypothetical protein